MASDRGIAITASRRKLLQLARSNPEQNRRGERAANSEGRAIAAIHARFRRAFWKELDRTSIAGAIRAETDAATAPLRALAGKPVTAAQRQARAEQMHAAMSRLDAIEREHGRILLNAARRVAERDDDLATILRALRKRGRVELKQGRFGAIRLKFIPHWADLVLPPLRAPQTAFVLQAPFDPTAAVTEFFSALAELAGANVSANIGDVDTQCAAAIAGYQMARAQLGGFLTIPAGFTKLKLQARIINVRAEALAFAVGASWASTGGIAEVTALDNNGVTRRETSINYVVAPVIFYAHDLFQGPHVINAEFPISRNGGEILVTAGLKSDSWAAAFAGALASAGGTVSKMTISLA